MVEDFIDGHDLAADLQLGVPWKRDCAADCFAAICDGLEALRKRSIVHRDLKPQNIRVRPDGTPVIIDFGLSRHLGLPDLTSTSAGAAIGTPLYFAPEQWSGQKRDIDHRTDLFALGLMLHQALLGAHAFYAPGVVDLQKAVRESDDYLKRPEFRALPKEWRLILARLLEKERAKRPQNAEQVATILRKIRGV